MVGYIGDEINDAPSLQAADVDISVSTGVDVAKDAADIILLEQSLHQGILEGRRVFGNVIVYLLLVQLVTSPLSSLLHCKPSKSNSTPKIRA